MLAVLTVWPNKSFKFLSMLTIGHHPAGFLTLIYLSEIDLLLIVPMPVW